MLYINTTTTNFAGRPNFGTGFQGNPQQNTGNFLANSYLYSNDNIIYYSINNNSDISKRQFNITRFVDETKWEGNFTIEVIDTDSIHKKLLTGTFAVIH